MAREDDDWEKEWRHTLSRRKRLFFCCSLVHHSGCPLLVWSPSSTKNKNQATRTHTHTHTHTHTRSLFGVSTSVRQPFDGLPELMLSFGFGLPVYLTSSDLRGRYGEFVLIYHIIHLPSSDRIFLVDTANSYWYTIQYLPSLDWFFRMDTVCSYWYTVEYLTSLDWIFSMDTVNSSVLFRRNSGICRNYSCGIRFFSSAEIRRKRNYSGPKILIVPKFKICRNYSGGIPLFFSSAEIWTETELFRSHKILIVDSKYHYKGRKGSVSRYNVKVPRITRAEGTGKQRYWIFSMDAAYSYWYRQGWWYYDRCVYGTKSSSLYTTTTLGIYHETSSNTRRRGR